jgi:hypothetical protein
MGSTFPVPFCGGGGDGGPGICLTLESGTKNKFENPQYEVKDAKVTHKLHYW